MSEAESISPEEVFEFYQECFDPDRVPRGTFWRIQFMRDEDINPDPRLAPVACPEIPDYRKGACISCGAMLGPKDEVRDVERIVWPMNVCRDCNTARTIVSNERWKAYQQDRKRRSRSG